MYLIFNEIPVDEEDAYEDVKVSESIKKSKSGGKFLQLYLYIKPISPKNSEYEVQWQC